MERTPTMAEPIGLFCPPVVKLSDNPAFITKIDNLKRQFIELFDDGEPTAYIRVPGRVNIIGEHIDYCGYSVCPMAVKNSIIVAVKVTSSDNFLELKNVDSSNYPDFTLHDSNFKIDLCTQGWASYYLCGIKGALEKMHKPPSKGFKVLVSGNIPPGSGLSSSSALVCSAFLTVNHIYEMNLSKQEIASLCAMCERYIGTAGGGMDQAIALLGTQGCAKHIEFSPLSTRDVVLPKNAVFVIAHSCVIKNKAASAEFNTRVVECRLAAQLICKKNSIPWKKIIRLVDVQKELKLNLKQMIETVENLLHSHPYTKKEICQELETTEEELNKFSLTSNTEHINEFYLKQRAQHVFEEARRVMEWCVGCNSGWDISALGKILTDSHVSLRDLYQCSHPKLDELVNICLDAGAAGARLTGAGWGGCAVALTTNNHVETFINSVKQKFYGSNTENVDKLIFSSAPCQGAEIFI